MFEMFFFSEEIDDDIENRDFNYMFDLAFSHGILLLNKKSVETN